MRQVPHYLIVGGGRVARHFIHYMDILGLDVSQWSRGQPEDDLKIKAQDASHILLLINDDAIEAFAAQYLAGVGAVKVHFSGALVSRDIYGAHPLMTFGADFYTDDVYRSMPFVIDDDVPAFVDLLPGFPNAYSRLPQKDKARYHALCVMAGNFSCLLWQKLFSDFENLFGMSPEIAHPYLRQQMQNLMDDYRTALTGPLARGDRETVEDNLAALRDDPFQQVYQAFAEAYPKIRKDEE